MTTATVRMRPDGSAEIEIVLRLNIVLQQAEVVDAWLGVAADSESPRPDRVVPGCDPHDAPILPVAVAGMPAEWFGACPADHVSGEPAAPADGADLPASPLPSPAPEPQPEEGARDPSIADPIDSAPDAASNAPGLDTALDSTGGAHEIAPAPIAVAPAAVGGNEQRRDGDDPEDDEAAVDDVDELADIPTDLPIPEDVEEAPERVAPTFRRSRRKAAERPSAASPARQDELRQIAAAIAAGKVTKVPALNELGQLPAIIGINDAVEQLQRLGHRVRKSGPGRFKVGARMCTPATLMQMARHQLTLEAIRKKGLAA